MAKIQYSKRTRHMLLKFRAISNYIMGSWKVLKKNFCCILKQEEHHAR